jgi:hypothetical protein
LHWCAVSAEKLMEIIVRVKWTKWPKAHTTGHHLLRTLLRLQLEVSRPGVSQDSP